jgi:hypothetical protein
MVVLDAQTADRRGHPAILIAMIVNAAALANLPTNGHALKQSIFENQVARVISLGEIAILVQSFRAHVVTDDVVLDIFESEVALGNGGDALHPIGDGEQFGCDVLWHEAPPDDNPENAGIAEEL